MTTAGDYFRRGLQILSALYPITFTWNGASYTGKGSEQKNAKKMREAGFENECDLTIHITRSAFTGPIPAANQIIMVGAIKYSIATLTQGADGERLVMGCILMV